MHCLPVLATDFLLPQSHDLREHMSAASLCSGAQSMSDLRERLARAVSQEMHAINQSRIDAAISEELVRITKADIPWSIIQAVRTMLHTHHAS